MKLLLIAFACALAGCSLDTVDDTPILLRHRGGDRVDQDAGAGVGGDTVDAGSQAGSAGVGSGGQAGSVSFGGAGQGGAGAAGSPQGGSPSAGSAGANAGSAGLGSTAGVSGAAGSAGLAGSAGDSAGGAPGGQGGQAGSPAAGAGGSTVDYFQACDSPNWATESAYVAAIPLRGEVTYSCGPYVNLSWEPGRHDANWCLFWCDNPELCPSIQPGSRDDATGAWRVICDCTTMADHPNDCLSR